MSDQVGASQIEQEPSSSKCFFCGEREAEPASVFVKEMVKVTQTKVSYKVTEVKYSEPHTVYIPRCAECKKASEMGSIFVAIGSVLVLGLMVVCAVVGVVVSSSINHQWGEEGLIGGGVCGCLSGILACIVLAALTSGKVDTTQRTRVEQYPEVAVWKEKGYN
jgi:hypothetical protein